MSPEDRELARDCWAAAMLLRHPTCGQPELPEWLAITASHLASADLPAMADAR